MQNNYDILVIGGGAAGFFAAIRAGELSPGAKIMILEKGKEVLQKVKISGGGRCNVTHACWDPNELTQYYPRGSKELRGPFHQFACGDTMEWFENRGIELKIEADGRVFPSTNKSQTIIDCFQQQIHELGIQVKKQQDVIRLNPPKSEDDLWEANTRSGETYKANCLLMATGSNKRVWDLLESLGHRIVQPVPSLFTFNIKDKRLHGIPGIAMPKAQLQIKQAKLDSEGPLLITHWGLSGPSVLKLSAWGARKLAERSYDFQLEVNWLGEDTDVLKALKMAKREMAKKQVHSKSLFGIPNRLWQHLLAAAHISQENWADLNKEQVTQLAKEITKGVYQVKGKSTFKEEFVTAGGLDLKEVRFKHFASKLFPRLYFAGEILNIDAITGGFNFQAAWTGGYLAGTSMAEEIA